MTENTDLCQIISVFDPDGEGGDFAYTVGLADRGLPELHLWARPGEGNDPGVDWMLSASDRHGILMQFAEDVVAGRLTVGSEHTEVYDDGLATVVFRLDPPVDAGDLEAYGARPANVIPVRWRLERPPAGLPCPVDPTTAADISARADVERWFVTVIAGRSQRVVYERTPYDTRHDQPVGPQSAVVRAVAAQLTHSNVELLNTIAVAMAVAEWAGWADGYDRALLAAHARVGGRSEACDEARALADKTVRELLGSPAAATPMLEALLTSLGLTDSDNCRDWVLDAIGRFGRTTLAAEAAADVIPLDLYLSATTVRDVVYVDRGVRPLPSERLVCPLVVIEAGHRIGQLSAVDIKPVESAIATMPRSDRAAFSETLLLVDLASARDRRALPGLHMLLGGQPAGNRLQRQRRTIDRRHADGLDVSTQRRRYRALVDALDCLAALITMPPDFDPAARDVLLAPVPPALLDRLGHVDVPTLEQRWQELHDRRAG